MKLTQVVLMSVLLASGGLYAEGYGKGGQGKGQGGHRALLRHANPMPNLMKVIKKEGDQLNLTAEQAKALETWRERHGEPMHAKAAELKKMEQALNQAAMEGRPKAELMNMASRIMNERMNIVSTKTDCRDNMRRILSAEQYNKVLALYQQMMGG